MKHALLFKDYNEALKNNRLLGLSCKSCGKSMTPPRLSCPVCENSSLEVKEFSGTGKIRTFTTLYVGATGREKDVPYVIVLVELDEGPWLMGNLDGVDPKTASMEMVGKTVKLTGCNIPSGDIYAHDENAAPLFSLV